MQVSEHELPAAFDPRGRGELRFVRADGGGTAAQQLRPAAGAPPVVPSGGGAPRIRGAFAAACGSVDGSVDDPSPVPPLAPPSRPGVDTWVSRGFPLDDAAAAASEAEALVREAACGRTADADADAVLAACIAGAALHRDLWAALGLLRRSLGSPPPAALPPLLRSLPAAASPCPEPWAVASQERDSLLAIYGEDDCTVTCWPLHGCSAALIERLLGGPLPLGLDAAALEWWHVSLAVQSLDGQPGPARLHAVYLSAAAAAPEPCAPELAALLYPNTPPQVWVDCGGRGPPGHALAIAAALARRSADALHEGEGAGQIYDLFSWAAALEGRPAPLSWDSGGGATRAPQRRRPAGPPCQEGGEARPRQQRLPRPGRESEGGVLSPL